MNFRCSGQEDARRDGIIETVEGCSWYGMGRDGWVARSVENLDFPANREFVIGRGEGGCGTAVAVSKQCRAVSSI